jgi:hypothetical protein
MVGRQLYTGNASLLAIGHAGDRAVDGGRYAAGAAIFSAPHLAVLGVGRFRAGNFGPLAAGIRQSAAQFLHRNAHNV